MGIRLKLVGFLMIFGFVILGALLWSNQYVLHKTMLHYVDQRDQQRLERLKNNLEVYLQFEPIEQASEVPRHTWLRLLHLSHRVDLSQNPSVLPLILERKPRRRPPPSDDFEQRVSLINTQGRVVFGPEMEKACLQVPVYETGRIVAHIGYHPLQELIDQADIEFAQTQLKMLSLGAVLITLLVLILLWPLANHFLVPIRQLTRSVRSLSKGDYQQRTEVNRKDEFGALQRDFNHLANTLEASLKSRNQWVADISHELRTPLTVLSGSIDAMRDGVRPLNEENLHRLHQEVALLQHLIEDLYQLSLSDVGALQYAMQSVDLNRLLAKRCADFAPDAQAKGLDFKTQFADSEAVIQGDEKRLSQMLNNLLQNALAYTDSRQEGGGKGVIKVSLKSQEKNWLLTIEDSAPGVDKDDLQKLPERFFRTEPSRNRRSGGAGLGLAMVSRIVQAHHGQLQFKSSGLGGIKVLIQLPKREGL